MVEEGNAVRGKGDPVWKTEETVCLQEYDPNTLKPPWVPPLKIFYYIKGNGHGAFAPQVFGGPFKPKEEQWVQVAA